MARICIYAKKHILHKKAEKHYAESHILRPSGDNLISARSFRPVQRFIRFIQQKFT